MHTSPATFALVLGLSACSNASAPGVDAPPGHQDGTGADTPSTIDAPDVAVRILVINEVAAGEAVDWFEIVNATLAPVQLEQFVFVDSAGDFTKAVPFPAMTLAPGAYFTQDVDGVTIPFKLASDEELWVYRASDHALSDGVDWDAGASPAGSSFARMPDIFGPFQTTTTQTRGTPNH
jgi:hypothetical protein